MPHFEFTFAYSFGAFVLDGRGDIMTKTPVEATLAGAAKAALLYAQDTNGDGVLDASEGTLGFPPVSRDPPLPPLVIQGALLTDN